MYLIKACLFIVFWKNVNDKSVYHPLIWFKANIQPPSLFLLLFRLNSQDFLCWCVAKDFDSLFLILQHYLAMNKNLVILLMAVHHMYIREKWWRQQRYTRYTLFVPFTLASSPTHSLDSFSLFAYRIYWTILKPEVSNTQLFVWGNQHHICYILKLFLY